MIRALCWKEYRVHRLSWLLVAGITLVVVCTLAVILPLAWRSAATAELLAEVAAGLVVSIASFYGLICGALMLAGEREARVMDYLDLLAGRRAPLWRTKALIGIAFTLGQCGVLGGLAVLVAWLDGRKVPRLPLVLLPLLALDGLAWGLAAAVLTWRSTLAVVLGMVLQLAAWVVAAGLGVLLDVHFLAVRVLLSGAAALFSYLVFCRPDLRRTEASSFAGLLLRAARHGWFEAAAVALFALLLLRSEPALWPLGVLLIGVMFGVMVFAGEQKDGKTRFLGDHWLPLHRAWLLRTPGLLIGATVASGAVLLTALHIADSGSFIRNPMLMAQEPPQRVRFTAALPCVGPWGLLILVVASGFSAGQLGGLWLRRRYFAVPVGCALSAAWLAFWLPSLMLGGQAIWPLLMPPLFLPAAVGAVVWGKSNGHAHTRRSLVLCSLLAVLWVSGVLWYRVVEIPEVVPFDIPAFEASLPPADSEAVVLMRRLGDQLDEDVQRPGLAVGHLPPGDWGREGVAPAEWGRAWVVATRQSLASILEKGWSKRLERELGGWLDALFAEKWERAACKLADLPLGLVADPRALPPFGSLPEGDLALRLGSLFHVRAAQLQGRGRDGEALDQLFVVLGLARQLRHKTPFQHLVFAALLEKETLSAFDLWLRQLGPRPDLLRRAADGLKRHEALLPSVSENVKAAYFAFPEVAADYLHAEAGIPRWLYQTARSLPWERAREQRLVKSLFAEHLAMFERPYWEVVPAPRPSTVRQGSGRTGKAQAEMALTPGGRLPQLVCWPMARMSVGSRELVDLEAFQLALLRAARLQVALVHHAVERGRPATTLVEVVPAYLPELPLDPFTGRPYCYRVSDGAQVVKSTDGFGTVSSQTIAAGCGILWSAGLDRNDNGGTEQGRDHPRGDIEGWATLGLDLIFVVPSVAKK